MSLADALNRDIDLASLSAGARRGLAWWGGELRAMLPPAWRAALAARPGLWVEPAVEGGWRVWRDGRHVAAARLAFPRGARVGLLPPPGAVLVRELLLPRLPPADTRRLVSLDIDRLSPLAPDLIAFDIAFPPAREADGSRQTVRLAILPLADARRWLALAYAEGVAPVALAAGPDGDGPRFDLLPAVRAAEGLPPLGRTRRRLLWAAAALIGVNLAVLVGRDVAEVARLRAAVDGQRPAVEAALRLRRRVDVEEARRSTLIERGRLADPLRLLDRLTQALPAGAWVERLEWDGDRLRLSGRKPAAFDIAAAVRGTGLLSDPRSVAPEGAAPAAPTTFDITARARREVRP